MLWNCCDRFYDIATLDLLASKERIIKKSMGTQVDSGSITKEEKAQLLEQVKSKLNTVTDEISNAKKENKPKKAEKLDEVMKKLESRQAMLSKITPQPPQPLKTEPQIAKLRIELKPLAKLERETKGRLLSIGEQAKMTRKTEIEDEIRGLENAAREWFEDDKSFLIRVELSRATTKETLKKAAQSASKNSLGTKGKSSGSSSWATTGTKKVGSAWSLPTASKSKTPKAPTSKQKAPGGMFAAMMDSDSDSD